jgi:lytic cellulose monooxygenase (C1-hydroxylating)
MRSAAFILGMATSVSAHARMYGVWVNGEDQGNGQDVYIRTPPNNSPVKDLSSPEIVCNVDGDRARPEFVSAAGGDTLSFEWYHDNRDDDIIDGSHKGPIITWIAEYTEGDATGAIWTKIAEDGFDGSQWAVDKLKANNGLNDITVPASLKPGQYLFRQEIIAHHESNQNFAENPARGAQFYPSCVQVEITSGGNAVPDQGFDFQTDYAYADPGITFDLYGSFTSYEIPGPAVWSGEGGSTEPEQPEQPEPTPTTTEPATTPTGTPAPTGTGAPTPQPTPTTPSECPARRRKRSTKNKKTKRAARRV